VAANGIVAMLMDLGAMRRGSGWDAILAAASKRATQPSPSDIGAFPALPAHGVPPALLSAALAAAPGRIQRLGVWWTGGGSGREGCAVKGVEWVCSSMDGKSFQPSETGWRAASVRAALPGLFLGTLPSRAAQGRLAPAVHPAGWAVPIQQGARV
jgi:hypothetical protein